MKCNAKTMLSVAVAMGLAALLAYLAFPEAKLFILANTSVLAALICPVSMLVMMWPMRGHRDHTDKPPATTSSEGQRPPQNAQIGRGTAS